MATGVGDWMKLRCGDRVAEREGRHVGRVEAIVHSHIIRVRWAYRMPDGEKLWIITEADRSSTTALLPGEY